MSAHVITIFGSAAPQPGERDYEQAREIGRAVAIRGWTVCNGGYGGAMEAAARGASEAGGHTIGVTCAAFASRGAANAFIREERRMPDLPTRLQTLLALADGYIVLPGGVGTLLELAAAWEFTNKRLAPAKPLVVLGAHWSPVIQTVRLQSPWPDSWREFDHEELDAALDWLRPNFASLPAKAATESGP